MLPRKVTPVKKWLILSRYMSKTPFLFFGQDQNGQENPLCLPKSSAGRKPPYSGYRDYRINTRR